MKYIEFHFENFKGIESVTLPLGGDVTTLIGLNESGKTTILEAIFCFSYGTEDLGALNPGLDSLRDPEKWIPIAERANFNKTIAIRATVELDDDDEKQLASHLRQDHKIHLTRVSRTIVITEKYVFANSRHTDTKRIWSLKAEGRTGQQRKDRTFAAGSAEWQATAAWVRERLPKILYFPNFLFDLPDTFRLTDDGVAVTQDERDRNTIYRSTFEEILNFLDKDADLQTHVVGRMQSAERADQRSLEALLLGMGRILTKTVFESWNRIFGRGPAAQEVEFVPDQDSKIPAVALRLKGPDGYYNLAERSLGFRWFFMFLMMTSFYKNEKNGQRSLFLLDEPASNLHSSAQAELLKSFETLLDRCALVYTTHSHHLIDVRWLDSAFVVKNAGIGTVDFATYLALPMDARTSISATPYRRFVAEHPDQTSYFQPVLDLLDYRPSVIEPVPEVVLVEGKSDFYLLRYLQEVLDVDRDLRFVPGTGAGSLDAAIRLHIGWGKSFVVLLDGDVEGQRQKERYEAEFGPVIEGRCVLLPDVAGDPACKEAENLLSTVDRQTITDHIFGASSDRPSGKKALSTAIRELYASRIAISLEPPTIERFGLLSAKLTEVLQQQSEV